MHLQYVRTVALRHQHRHLQGVTGEEDDPQVRMSGVREGTILERK